MRMTKKKMKRNIRPKGRTYPAFQGCFALQNVNQTLILHGTLTSCFLTFYS
jgi:hypothetical protein